MNFFTMILGVSIWFLLEVNNLLKNFSLVIKLRWASRYNSLFFFQKNVNKNITKFSNYPGLLHTIIKLKVKEVFFGGEDRGH